MNILRSDMPEDERNLILSTPHLRTIDIDERT